MVTLPLVALMAVPVVIVTASGATPTAPDAALMSVALLTVAA
jgi:hypothetical protein